MKPSYIALSIVAITGLTVLPQAAEAADLALKRVLLSTGGVGYFEYETEVDGPGQLALTVRRDQVDDVLKSLVVYDDKGGIGAVELPGDQPLVDAFRELPFDRQSLADPADLLNALRGAEVSIAGPKQLKGRIVSVTRDASLLANNAGAPLQHRLSLMTPDGLQSIVLESVEAVHFTDPKLDAAINRALAAEAANADKERRTLSLRLSGTGHRLVRVAYLAEVPLWKATYRLTLEPGEAKTADLQGWAVVENRAGVDWSNVELTLVSGDPATFRQALYSTYYVKRPEVPVEVIGRILPAPDTGAIAQLAAKGSAPVPGTRQDFVRAYGTAGTAAMASAPAPMRPAEVAVPEAADTQTQVSFRLPQPVTLKNGASMLVPIVMHAVPAARLSVYQPATDPAHPLAAVDMTNDSGGALPPGVLTLYEQAAAGQIDYLGDARLNPVPPGEHRLLSYALDRRVKIDRTFTTASRSVKARIADGILELTTADQQRTAYVVAMPPKETRRLVIEVPRMGGDWTLVEPDPKDVELAANAWRLTRDLNAGQTLRFTVTLERPVVSRFGLTDLNPDQMGYYASAATLTDGQRKAFEHMRELAAVAAEQTHKLAALETQRKELVDEQERVRSNLAAVPKGGDAERRYLKMLEQQEDGLAKLSTDVDNARRAQDVAKSQLADYIKGLKL